MAEPSSKRIRFWQHHVEGYLSGELTLREYCSEHDLKLSTFGYWRRRLAGDTGGSRSALNIVRVDVAALGTAKPSMMEVVLGNGRCIRVPDAFDARALARLVSAMESES